MKRILDSSDQVIYIGIESFTNLSNFLKQFPESKEKLTVFQMAGAIDYSRYPGWVDHNIKIDKEAARHVLSSGIDISLVMLQTTSNPVYAVDNRHIFYKRLESSDKAVHQILRQHLEISYRTEKGWPHMHDPLTVAAALGKDFVDFYESAVSMNKRGNLFESSGSPKLRLSKPESKAEEFMRFLDKRLFS